MLKVFLDFIGFKKYLTLNLLSKLILDRIFFEIYCVSLSWIMHFILLVLSWIKCGELKILPIAGL